MSLFQAGLQHSRHSEHQIELAVRARQLMAQRLYDLRDPVQFAALIPGTSAWQNDGDLRSRWVISRQELYSPDSSLEQAFVDTNRKLLANSAYRLELQLDQGDLQMRWLGSCTEPARGWATSQPLTIQVSGSNPLPRGLTLDLTVACTAADGLPLKDMVVSWTVVPLDGVGTLEAIARDGSRARFRNQTRRKNGTIKYVPGTCYVLAQATYAGETRQIRSAPIVLSP